MYIRIVLIIQMYDLIIVFKTYEKSQQYAEYSKEMNNFTFRYSEKIKTAIFSGLNLDLCGCSSRLVKQKTKSAKTLFLNGTERKRI